MKEPKLAEQDFQRLLDLITKTTEQIGRLEGRINALQSEIKSGDLGTGQIRQLNQEIDKLVNNLTQKRTTQIQLINQRDLIEATKGFDTLAKSIDTTERKIEELRQKRASIVPGSFGSRTDADFFTREIEKMERALSSFQSRMRNQYSALGYRQTPEERNRPFEPVDLEGRLNPASQGGRIRATAGQMVAQLRDDFVAGMEAEARRLEYQRKNPIAGRIANRPTDPPNITRIAGGYGSEFDPEVYRDALRAREEYDNYVRRVYQERANRARQPRERMSLFAQETEPQLQPSFGGIFRPGQQTQQEYDSIIGQKGTPSAQQLVRLNRQEAIAQAEKEALDSVRNKIQTERRYTSVLEAAAKQGFALDDLVRARTKGTAGIEEYQFRRRDSQGVQQDLSLFNAPSGRTTPGISNQFRTFGQGVVRDIGELTKWSIALAAVYGPMRQLQQLTETMIANQSRLAEATVTVSSSFLDQQGIFEIAAESAEFAGESISGVIDAFTQAYRAAGGQGNEVERLATAQNLLNDALILSKLSTLDQAQAIDTLSAAVRQTGGDFTLTTELLDSWVRVTKVANVDLATLSTGFAVLGDAAEAAGFDMNELNGLIALIAESSQSSGQEVANAARAIVGGLQSEQGTRALENLGIATRTTTGELRSLEEILLEVSSLIESGVISETQLAGLGQDIGGGVRRGAIVTTVLSNYSRAQQVAAESAKANGDAQAALEKQLATVQTSLTQLGNAFDTLAQTLGTEGGFLGIITNSVDGMTSLVKVFEGLTGALGKATPALAAFIATSLLLRSRGQGGISQAIAGFSQSLTTLSPEHERLNQITGVVPRSERIRQGIGDNLFGTNLRSSAFQGLLASAIPAALNLANTDDRFRGTKATADAAGGIVGGIVGSLAGPQGTIIGATIGIAISEAFVNSTIARSTDIFGYTTAPRLAEETVGGGTTEELDEALRQAEIELYKSIGGGSEAIGKILTTGATLAAEDMVEGINEAIRTQDLTALGRATARGGIYSQNVLQQAGVTPELIQQAFSERKEIEFDSGFVAFQRASEEAQRAFREAESARLAKGDVEGQVTPFSEDVAELTRAFRPLLDSIKESTREQLAQDRVAGDIKGAEYGRRTEALGGFDVRAVQYYAALGNEVGRLTGDATDAAGAFEVLNNVIVFGSEESLPQLTSISGEIQELVNLLEDPVLHEDALAAFGGADIARLQLEDLRVTLANLIQDANQEAILGRVKIPNIQGDINKPLTGQEETLVQQRTQTLQDAFYKGSLQLSDDIYAAIKDGFEEFRVPVKEFEDSVTAYRSVVQTDAQFRQAAIAQLIEEGRLSSQQTDPFGIQQLDITSQQGSGLQGMIDYFTSFLSREFPQYEQNPEQIGVIFSDYVTAVLHGDNLAIKLALDGLNDKAQKQLDGQYNIPEGATFWVPLTAAYYRPENQGGMGGLPAVDSAAVDGNTNATDRNTQALDSLNLALQNEIRRGVPPLETRERYLRNIDPGNLAAQNEQRRHEVPLAAQQRYNLALTNEQRRYQVPSPAAGQQQYPNNAGITNLLDRLFNWLQGISSRPATGVAGAVEQYRGITAQSSAQQVNPQVNARLELQIDNNTQLIVDGRILASIVSPYLAQEMVRLEAAQGTVTRRYVI